MYHTRALAAAALMLCAAAQSIVAQCNTGNLKPVSEFERNSLVIDVRPNEINQFKGKSSFKDEARIVLVNMNPFLFSYTLKVDQTEIHDTGFLNFLKLLGAPVTDLIGSVSASSRSKALSTTSGGNLLLLINRTAVPPAAPHASCPKTQAEDAALAIGQLAHVRTVVLKKKDTVDQTVRNRDAEYAPARTYFNGQKDIIFDASVEAPQLCIATNTLHGQLSASGYPTMDTMRTALTDVRDFQSMVEELKNSALEFKTEYDGCPARVKGLNYADNLVRLADELAKLGKDYEAKVSAQINETKGYDALVSTITKLNNHEGQTLQREYTVFSQYDISALDITATAVPLGEEVGLPVRQDLQNPRFPVVGDTQAAQRDGNGATQGNARIVNVGTTDSAQGVRVFAPHRASLRARQESSGDSDSGGAGDNGNGNGGGAKQIKTTGIIGARRFEISAGMVFSSLDRREFQPVLGFPRNEQGEIIDPDTGDPTTERNLTKIVGVSEQTSTRFAPLAMLHYRLPFSRNFFASVGFTGKRDDYGVDLEYLIGPSVLYKNMFFTFGGYAGKQQKLAGDLFDGAAIEGDIPVRKDYKWGFGFSFTYRLPLGDKKSGR